MPVGKVGEFDLHNGNWSLYVERLEMYFKANDVEEEKYLPTLIAVIGDGAYELLSNLVSPQTPSELEYSEVVQAIKAHLEPKASFMAERHRFRQRRQNGGETISQYLAELKRLSKFCEFGTVLEDNLRDQFVCCLKNETIKQRLFAKEKLTYGKAVSLALSLESAERDAAMMEQPGASGSNEASGANVTANGAATAQAQVNSLTSQKRVNGKNKKTAGKMQSSGIVTCKVCGRKGHRSEECRFKDFACNNCGKTGHLRRVCTAAPPWRNGGSRPRPLYHFDAEDGVSPEEDPVSDVEDFNHLCLNGYRPVSLSLRVDDVPLVMEIDTGTAVSCISKETYTKYFQHRRIEPFNLVLKFYDGTSTRPLGVIKPVISFENVKKPLELFVIEGGTTSLLGRQWLAELGIRIPIFNSTVNATPICNNLRDLLDRHKEIFNGGLGRFTGGKARLRVREEAEPVFCRARPLPYSLRQRVDTELDEMLKAGVIEPVETSEWATPLVPVRKADGGLRLCADYKVTLNPALLIDRYPLPKIDDLLVGLNGNKVFSKIDLSQAYNQIELDETSKFTVINTHRGLFKYNRLVFGLSSSPGIFQRIMSTLFNDIQGVEVFLDDIIISSVDVESHFIILEKVLGRLDKHGMKLKKSKCSFLVDEVQYLGYLISGEGIKVDPSKVEAIVKIPRPQSVTEVRSFLGLVNFYAKFVRGISTILAPLYDLLRKGKRWEWSTGCEQAFRTIKSILTNAEVLKHYDPKKQLVLTCDASARGIGGVLTQPCGAGAEERPVAYVSRSLNSAERNYSQIDREALAIVFCLEKLHQYLYGRHFLLRTDHKPLVSIFGPKQGIPSMVASRLQRWAIKLSAYTYDIEYVNTKENGADGLSRLPVAVTADQERDLPEQTYLHFASNDVLLDYQAVKRGTQRDPILSRVLNYIRNGWPSDIEVRNLQPYYNRRQELYEELGCVMWGHRVVVPDSCRAKVLFELHEGHMGIVKTKAFARSYVWWAGIDEALEKTCRECVTCAMEAEAPTRHAPCPWPWPSKPWTRVHLDFLGPLFGKMYLIMVDARTKWIEVFPVASTAATITINKLSEVCARWGLPKQIVTDNGPPFTSNEFSKFLVSNGIDHLFSAPYHPASNGAAENTVRIIKKVIKKAVRQNEDISLALNTFLLHYRNTAHCTTGESPASLMLGKSLRTKLDAIRPSCEDKVKIAQEKQTQNAVSSHRSLQTGDEVWLRQFQGSNKWIPGRITQRLSTTDYRVADGTGKENHRHIDQLRRRSSALISSVEPSALHTPGEVEPVSKYGPQNRPVEPAAAPEGLPLGEERGGRPFSSLSRKSTGSPAAPQLSPARSQRAPPPTLPTPQPAPPPLLPTANPLREPPPRRVQPDRSCKHTLPVNLRDYCLN